MSQEPVELITRRLLSKYRSTFVLALLMAVVALGLMGCSQDASSHGLASAAPSGSVPAKVVIVSDKEPGDQMIISGTIYAPDGRTPLKDIDLFVYQTDATGLYSTSGSRGDNRNTRIHGLVPPQVE